jgi:hypothetical protein
MPEADDSDADDPDVDAPEDSDRTIKNILTRKNRDLLIEWPEEAACDRARTSWRMSQPELPRRSRAAGAVTHCRPRSNTAAAAKQCGRCDHGEKKLTQKRRIGKGISEPKRRAGVCAHPPLSFVLMSQLDRQCTRQPSKAFVLRFLQKPDFQWGSCGNARGLGARWQSMLPVRSHRTRPMQ